MNMVNKINLIRDPEILKLKEELQGLELQLNNLTNEKIELEKYLSDFQHRHAIELGEIIKEILKLRKFKFKNDRVKYEEAENDEQQYHEQLEKEKEKFELNEAEKEKLKSKFRKAILICHPDKVSDDFKESAQRIFIELKEAYDINDLKKVSEILEDLEKGNYFKTISESITEKDILKTTISKFCKQINNLVTEIITIKESDTFETISNIEDWDEYFKQTKKNLQHELEELQIETQKH